MLSRGRRSGSGERERGAIRGLECWCVPQRRVISWTLTLLYYRNSQTAPRRLQLLLIAIRESTQIIEELEGVLAQMEMAVLLVEASVSGPPDLG